MLRQTISFLESIPSAASGVGNKLIVSRIVISNSIYQKEAPKPQPIRKNFDWNPIKYNFDFDLLRQEYAKYCKANNLENKFLSALKANNEQIKAKFQEAKLNANNTNSKGLKPQTIVLQAKQKKLTSSQQQQQSSSSTVSQSIIISNSQDQSQFNKKK